MGAKSEAGVDTLARDPRSNLARSEYTFDLGQTRGLPGGRLVMFEWWHGVEWGEWNGRVVGGCGRMLGWWIRGMDGMAAGGGMVVWRLHGIMSVRIVFGCICDDSKLELRGGTPGSSSSW